MRQQWSQLVAAKSQILLRLVRVISALCFSFPNSGFARLGSPVSNYAFADLAKYSSVNLTSITKKLCVQISVAYFRFTHLLALMNILKIIKVS